MAALARQRSLKTIVGLQARSDPAICTTRDLIQQGYIGDVLHGKSEHGGPGTAAARPPAASLAGRTRQRRNVLTITGGHAIDALCAVLGEFAELSARLRSAPFFFERRARIGDRDEPLRCLGGGRPPAWRARKSNL